MSTPPRWAWTKEEKRRRRSSERDYGTAGIVRVGSRRRSLRPGWDRLSDPGDKLNARWRHDSGWEIRHCGHPTAHRPYYVDLSSELLPEALAGELDIGKAGRELLARCYGTLVEAQRAVEAVPLPRIRVVVRV